MHADRHTSRGVLYHVWNVYNCLQLISMSETRTTKSIKNSIVALILYAINLSVQFVSRKAFIDYLGEDVLGLNTTATSLLQFLNLAELGIGSAIGYTLYKPLYEKDIQSINEILTLQGWIYRRIATFVIVCSVILMLFFPIIFSNIDLPLWYAYGSFSALLFSALLSYFVNYKQILLTADQKDYKVQYTYKLSMLAKLVVQILAIKYLDNGYVWWLIIEFGFAIIASVALNYTIRRTYPYLNSIKISAKELINKHPNILIKTKQVFFHKIGSFALTQTSPLIIYTYLSLGMVAIYGNYMLIITGVTSLMVAILNGINAGIGNLIAENDKKKIFNVFEELFSIRFLLTLVLCFTTYMFAQEFMTLWIGKEFLINKSNLLIMISIMYINLSRLTVDAFINGYGLFRDVWAPLLEAVLNIGFSILLGYYWGLTGILCGVFISLFIVIFCWKPYFLFKFGLKQSLHKYFILYFRHILAGIIGYFVITTIYQFVFEEAIYTFIQLVKQTVIYFTNCLVILFIIMMLTTKGMPIFTKRIIYLISKLFK